MPSIFLSFYGSQWVWLVLEFFLEWYGLIKNVWHVSGVMKNAPKKIVKKKPFCWFWTRKRGWLPSRQPEKYAKCFNVLGTRTQHLPHNTWDKNKIKKNYSRSSFLLGVNLCNIWYIVKSNFVVIELWNLNSSKKWHLISLYGLATFIDTPRNTSVSFVMVSGENISAYSTIGANIKNLKENTCFLQKISRE